MWLYIRREVGNHLEKTEMNFYLRKFILLNSPDGDYQKDGFPVANVLSVLRLKARIDLIRI